MSSSVHGLKATLPSVRRRPSFSLAAFSAWLLTIGGTTNQAALHTIANASVARPNRIALRRVATRRGHDGSFMIRVVVLPAAARR